MGAILLAIWILAVPAIICLAYLQLAARRWKHILEVEMEFPTFVNSMVEGLRNGEALETALFAAATTSAGPIRRLTDRLNDRVTEGETFGDAIIMLGEESGSKMIQRSVGMLRIALEQGAEMADTLERITKDTWSIYVLQLERRSLAKKEAKLLVMGGVVMAPAILGITFSMFATAGAGDHLMNATAVYLLAFAFLTAIFYGVVSGKMLDATALAIPYMFISMIIFYYGLHPTGLIGLMDYFMANQVIMVSTIMMTVIFVAIIWHLRRTIKKIREPPRRREEDDDWGLGPGHMSDRY